MREFCRERVEVLDDWRRSQEIRGTCHECCRNAARQVRLASGLMRKRIEDSETEGTKFQREPGRSTGFVLDEWKGRTQELLEFQLAPWLCRQPNQQSNCNHLDTAFRDMRLHAIAWRSGAT
jgi:hypothetical protein